MAAAETPSNADHVEQHVQGVSENRHLRARSVAPDDRNLAHGEAESATQEQQLDVEGDPLPFPADLSDEPIRDFLGDYGPVSLEDGIEETYDAFRRLLAAGALSPRAIA